MLFSERILRLRQEAGLSQRKIAEELGLSLLGYQRYEMGTSKPNFDKLIALCDFFNVSADYLLGRTDKP